MKLSAFVLIALVFPVLCGNPAAAQSPDISALPDAIASLSSNNPDTVCHALEQMSRTCDQSCVPYIADALRHLDPRVSKAAANAAMSLGNPRLAPALHDILRHHPVDDVRLEALKALIRLGRAEDYDELLRSIDTDKPHEIHRRILRSLPPKLAQNKAAQFAMFARFPALVTSVVAAYQHDPEPLFGELLSRLITDDNPQLLRALALLSKYLPKDFSIQPHQAQILDNIPSSMHPDVAAVQASLSTPQAARWLLAHMKSLKPAVWLEIFSRIHGRAASQIADAIISNDSADENTVSWSRDIAPMPFLADAFLQTIQSLKTQRVKELALWLCDSKNPGWIRDALSMLAPFSDDPEVRQRILKALGHNDISVAFQAMQIASHHLEFWPSLVQMIESSPSDDRIGRTYYARYALVWLALYFRQDISSQMADTALQTAVSVSSWRLHAEPALRLIVALNQPLVMPNDSEFAAMRPDIQRIYLKSANTLNDLSMIRASLQSSDEAVAAEALDALVRNPQLAEKLSDPSIDEVLSDLIKSKSAVLSTHAMVAAARLERTNLVHAVTNRLVDENPYIAYDALWALQKMRALPDQHWLKALYYRAPDGVLRDRLGFLTGLGENPIENFQAQEIRTQTPIHSGQLLQLSVHHRPGSSSTAELILEDQSLALVRSSVFGIIVVP